MNKNIKMTQTQKKLWSVLKFLIIFNILSIPLQLIIYFNVNVYPLAFIERAQASFMLNILGINHQLINTEYPSGILPAISINQQVLAIGEPCTALRSILAFSALIIASPKKLKNKKTALLLIPIIYEANILRIITLVIISLINPGMLELIHTILWREGMLAVIIILWIYWLNRGELLTKAIEKMFKIQKTKAL